jgi:hypothetical protein
MTIRATLIGLGGAALVAGAAPFNDYVLNNSPLIGGSFPAAAVLVLLGLIVLNALLKPNSLRNTSTLTERPTRDRRLSSSELALVLGMVLVACAIPTSGLMRYWQPTLVGTAWHSADSATKRGVIESLDLPTWFFPSSDSNNALTDPVTAWFYDRIPPDAPPGSFLDMLTAWAPPVLGWGVFFAAIFAAIGAISFVVARQWIENERIAFPLGEVQSLLIDAPTPGQRFNSTLASKPFLIAFGGVLILRFWNTLADYHPRYVPEIPMSFSLRHLIVDPPFGYMDGYITYATIYPLVIAIAFFMATRISFSLVFFVLASQIPIMAMASAGNDLNSTERRDLNLGALLAFAGMILWTGRHYYLRVVRGMFVRQDAPTRWFVSPALCGWVMVLGIGVSVAWLMLCGMTLGGAVLLVIGLLMTWVVMANVVAHAGLPVAVTMSGPREWFVGLFPNTGGTEAASVAGVSGHVSNQFMVQTIGGMWAYASDQLAVYKTHALRAVSSAGDAGFRCDPSSSDQGRRLVIALVLALVVSYGVGHVSTLAAYYHFSASLDATGESPINKEVLVGQPKWLVDHTVRTHQTGLAGSNQQHEPWPWVAGGAGLTGLLAALQLRIAWWPLHPIGFLMVFSFPMRRLWFSILLGWLVKVLIVRFGGAGLFRAAKPFFVGVIVAEVVASGFLAIFGAGLAAAGYEPRVQQFMPATQF